MNFTEMKVDDFSGGITDYVLAAQPNQSAVIENLLINPNKKLESAPGSQIYDAAMYIVPVGGNPRVCGIFASLLPELLINSARQIWRPNVSAFQELVGPSSNPAFSVGTTSSFPAFSDWNTHVFATNSLYAAPIKMYIDGSGVWQTRTAGMPALATAPSVVSSGGVGVSNYLYAFLNHYTYNVGTTTFEDFGTTKLVPLVNVNAPNVSTVNITAIPVIANGATGNYDTASANLRVYIYRTLNNGSVYYKVGDVANGTTVFNDSMSDATAILQTTIYTTAGILDNDTPPLAKYITIVNGVAYYGNIQSGSQIFKNRVQQSVQNDPDSCPVGLFVDLNDEVTGLSSYNDNPLVFTKGHAYRLNGQYSQLGQGQVTFEDITKTIGCLSHLSIVQTRYGVFWAGDDGFYWTDGFQFKKVSDSINERYKLFVSDTTRSGRIVGTYDKKDNRVYWAVTADPSSSDNDSFAILDLRWGINDASSFTTRVNGAAFAPTALAFYAGQLIRGDRRGFILKHDANYNTDPSIDTTIAPSSWTTKAIIPNYSSIVSSLGYSQVRKWVSKILLTMENVTNASVQINSINDNSSAIKPLKEIRYRGNVLWGDPFLVWGADTPQWSFFNLIENMRRFPANGLRCSYKQIQITQSFTNIYKSDDTSTAAVDRGTKKATLTNVTFSWPSDSQDYYISFDSDGYTQNYQIQSRTSATVLTLLDPLSSLPTSTCKWVIRGYPKGEIFKIISYVIYFAPMTDQSYKYYRTGQDDTGTNS